MSMQFPFPVDPALTGATLSYKSPRLIADKVLPIRIVGKSNFKFLKRTRKEDYSIPDVRVGRGGRPGEREFTATETTDATIDFALDSPVPAVDVQEAPPGFDPIVEAALGLTRIIRLNREKRCADLVFNPDTYPSGNKVTLSGTSKWSDYTDSNPVTAIIAALEVPFERPNKMVIGRGPFTTLSQHPKMVKAAFGNDAVEGVATREQIARVFDLDEVLIGEARLNMANIGQAENYARVWGNACALIYAHEDGSGNENLTFGFTAQWLDWVAGTAEDKSIGMRGGTRVRVGHSIREIVAAPDLGYLFTDPV